MTNTLACYQLLELNVISAQDLAPVGRSMRTYAVAWIDAERKLSTRVDPHGGVNPTWNDKFVFRVGEDLVYDDTSLITIDIYAIHWFKDIHVGTAQVLTADLIPPTSQGMQFAGLQIHRPSGRPKGILNIGAAVLDGSMRSMPLYTHEPKGELRRTKSDTSSMVGSEAMAHAKKGKASSVVTPSEVSSKSPKTKKKGKSSKRVSIGATTTSDYNVVQRSSAASQRMSSGYQQWSTPAMAYHSNNNPLHNINRGAVRPTPLHALDKVVYGTPYRTNLGRPIMTDSELGPSASEVAAAVARHPLVEEGDNSTVGGWSLDDETVEGVQPKVERWRTELPPVYDGGEMSSMTKTTKKERQSRRHSTDGVSDKGLFSCFSVICGVQCSIVCGGDNKRKNRRRRVQSTDDASFL